MGNMCQKSPEDAQEKNQVVYPADFDDIKLAPRPEAAIYDAKRKSEEPRNGSTIPQQDLFYSERVIGDITDLPGNRRSSLENNPNFMSSKNANLFSNNAEATRKSNERPSYSGIAPPEPKKSSNFYGDIAPNKNPTAGKSNNLTAAKSTVEPQKPTGTSIYLNKPQIDSLRQINQFQDLLDEKEELEQNIEEQPKNGIFASRETAQNYQEKSIGGRVNDRNGMPPVTFDDVIEKVLTQPRRTSQVPTKRSSAVNKMNVYYPEKYTDRTILKSPNGMNPDKIQFQNGDVYEGEIIDYQPHGFGKLKTAEFVYEGQFKNELFQGKGTIRYNNGEVFEGEFADGLKEGYGYLKDKNGRVIREGNWANGIFANA